MTAPFAELSNEEAILNFIFDPHKSFIGFDGEAANSLLATSTASTASITATTKPEDIFLSDEELFLQNREREAIRLADQDNYTQALRILDEIIKQYSDRPSAYNNRAQVKRLQGSDDNVLEDLNTAISIASSKVWNIPNNGGNLSSACSTTASTTESSNSSTVETSTIPVPSNTDTESSTAQPNLNKHQSDYYKNVLKQAHTQRAIYYHKQGKEDLANQDLDAAASYGSRIAQMMTTGTNPYATLCHHTVQMMLDTEKYGKLDSICSSSSNDSSQ